jgi:hypothetical protein
MIEESTDVRQWTLGATRKPRRGVEKEPSYLFRRSWDAGPQIQMCAHMLCQIHQFVDPKGWQQLSEMKRGELNGNRELKFIVRHFIRWSSESVDCRRTVDFITKKTFERIRLASTSSNISGTRWDDVLKGLTHEHMVPCEFIFQWITGKSVQVTVEYLIDLLTKIGLRALVEGKSIKQNADKLELGEVQKLDGTLKKVCHCILTSPDLNIGPSFGIKKRSYLTNLCP